MTDPRQLCSPSGAEREGAPLIPVPLRVHLAHAVVQAVADEAGVDILHVKGPAAADVRGLGRPSVDADVLVRPSHLQRFCEELRAHRWTKVTRLYSGGVVEHSTNWYHGELGQLDVHARFPGIMLDPEVAFESLWRARDAIAIAHRTVAVPSPPAHRLVILVHSARNPGERGPEMARAWVERSPADRAEIRRWASQLRAEVALAAAIGELDHHRGAPDHVMWELYATGFADAPTLRQIIAATRGSPYRGFRRLKVFGFVFHLILNKRHRMEQRLGRMPTALELLRGYAVMLVDGFRWRHRSKQEEPPTP